MLLAAELIADINKTPVPDYISGVTLVGSVGYFSAVGPFGKELYRTNSDYTSASLVRDLAPGSLGSNIYALTAVGNEVFFAANDGQHGQELYRSDGTETGTVRVTDVIPDDQTDSEVFGLAGLSDRIFFIASVVPQSFGTATLFAYTPSTGQLLPLFNTYSHFEGIGIGAPVTAGGKVYFPAIGNSGSWELWTTDGTVAGTVSLRILIPNSFPQTNPVLAPFNDRLLFTATTIAKGNELYITNGTSAGTSLLSDIAWGSASSAPSNFRTVGSEAYFSADDGIHGREVWKTDGTAEGTVLVADVEPGAVGSSPYLFARSGASVSFIATAGASGKAIWSTDGTDAKMLLDLGESVLSPLPHNIVSFDGFALFNYSEGMSGSELWRTDGTTSGTYRVVDLNPGEADGVMNFSQVTVYPHGILYMGNDGIAGGELWKSDGTATGTTLVENIRFGTGGSTYNEGAVFSNGKFYHRHGATDGVNGFEPWVFDRNGATRLGDLMPGLADSNPSAFAAAGGVTYFAGRDPEHGSELWRTDGTLGGTKLVKDVNPGVAHGTFSPICGTSSGNVYFIADDGVHGRELWFSDGTEAGTRLIADTVSTTQFLHETYLTTVGELAFFIRNDEITGRNTLWRSDGTAIGTYPLSVTPNFGSSSMNDRMVVMNGAVYFPAGGAIWRSDGTPAGTFACTPPNSGNVLMEWHGSVYYAVYDFSTKFQLWRTDGTPNGGVLVKDFGVGGYLSSYSIASAGDRLVFAGGSATQGVELWSTDGTTAGTQLVKDITPGLGGSDLSYFTSAGDLVFVRQGSTLWVTDGMPGHASRVDLGIGSTNSYGFYFFGAADGVLYLDLWNEQYGREPWRFEYAGLDLLTPGIASAQFNEDRREVTLTISEAVSLGSDLLSATITNTTTNSTVSIPPSAISLRPGGREIVVDVSQMGAGGGRFSLHLPRGLVSDASGNNLQDPFDFSFAQLAGDLNHDSRVNFSDLQILMSSYGRTGQTYSQGNIDYSPDGLVGFDDLLILAQRYGTTLLSTAGAPSSISIRKTGRMWVDLVI